MARGDHKIEGPFATWAVRVESQNRIRLPSGIRSVVPWLKMANGALECVATPGPSGGVQVRPLEAYELSRKEFVQTVGERQPVADDASARWVDIARLFASSWRVSVNVEASRISVTLPEPLRQARQLPDVEGAVVVFAFGEILEVWDAAEWHKNVRNLARAKERLMTEAMDELGDLDT